MTPDTDSEESLLVDPISNQVDNINYHTHTHHDKWIERTAAIIMIKSKKYG